LPKRGPSKSEQFAQGISRAAAGTAQHLYQQEQKKNQQENVSKFLDEQYGIKNTKDLPAEFQMEIMKTGQAKKNKLAGELTEDQKKTNQDIFSRALVGLATPEEEASLPIADQLNIKKVKQKDEDINLKKNKPAPTKAPLGGLGGQPVPEEYAKKMDQILNDNPDATADQLRIKLDKAGIPSAYSNPYTENRRRSEEQTAKTKQERKNQLRQETLPLRTDMAKKSQIAEQSIRNKEGLIEIIKKGKIDDPTYAALAESLPLNLGKRMLSPDTLEYKAGLVEEYNDLKNIFPGATRVKEIELLEAKIADTYLTDDQKLALLKSRINAEKAHIIRAEAAAQLEDRDDLGILQFAQEVEKLASPKLNALFDQILDEQKSIIDSAERRKNLPLDLNDPDDIKIIDSLLEEANGNATDAKKLATKKGYKW
jgi:hypothetical protein